MRKPKRPQFHTKNNRQLKTAESRRNSLPKEKHTGYLTLNGQN